MCMMIAAESVSAWLQSQERIMRAWRDALLFNGGASDDGQIERIDAHCRWLADERARLEGEMPPSARQS